MDNNETGLYIHIFTVSHELLYITTH